MIKASVILKIKQTAKSCAKIFKDLLTEDPKEEIVLDEIIARTKEKENNKHA